jgi:hypothetical protein
MRKLPVIAVAIFLFLSACTKIESTDIGNGLIGPLSSVATFDTTLDVTTANFPEENIPRVYKTDDHVIGVINNDPLFGKTTASAYFELKPSFFPFTFAGKDLKVDSVVLILRPTGIFGDSTIPQNWDVREVAQMMRFDSAYSTNAVIATAGILNATTSKIVDIRRRDSTGKLLIRLKLDKSFADRFFKYDTATNSGAYFNDSIFRERFAGFALVPSGSGNVLISINLQDTITRLAFYYTSKATETATTRDTLVSNFRFSSGSTTIKVSATANRVDRDRTGSAVASYLNTNKNDEVFIQTSPGTFATIKVPGLRTFPNAIIHRAELIAEQDSNDPLNDAMFFAPRFLLLSAYDSINKYKTNVRNDFVYTDDAGPNIQAFGGFRFYKNVSIGTVAAFNFDLTRYVQGIVTRKDSSYTLRLSAPSNDSLFYTAPYPAAGSGISKMLYLSPATANVTAFGRVRLAGGNKSNPLRMRLRIIYSKI